MTKNEFILQLRNNLSDLSQEDIQKSVDYYSEMIDDRMEDGLTEEEAVEAIGSVDEISHQILMDTPLPKLVKAKVTPKREMKGWEILLIVLGFPIWFPLLIAAASVVFAVFVTIWSVIISLYAVVFSLFVAASGCLVAMFNEFNAGNMAHGALALGASFICAGTAILLFLLFNQIAKLIIRLCKLIINAIKSCFVKKGIS